MVVNTPVARLIVTGRAGRALVVPEEKSTDPEATLDRTKVRPLGSEEVPAKVKFDRWKVPRAGLTTWDPGLARDTRNGT